MPCPECAENCQRAQRAVATEQLLALFTKTFSNLASKLWEMERDADNSIFTNDYPPTEDSAPVSKRGVLLVPTKMIVSSSDIPIQRDSNGAVATEAA